MRKIEQVIYSFNELSIKAQEKAVREYRESIFKAYCDYEYIIDEMRETADIIGIENIKIYFSGFSSQGDGACFDGIYRYRKGALKSIIKFAPLSTELHTIVKTLQEAQRKHFYNIVAKCTQSGMYYHANSMQIDVSHTDDIVISDDIENALKDFADYIYKRLKNDYNDQRRDETITENIIDNDYEFYENGEMFDKL